MSTTPEDRVSIANALFTRTQQRVLGLLYGNPDRSYFAKEIIRAADVGSGAVQRELRKLSSAGLLTVCDVGNQRHYQANRNAPVFDALHALVIRTSGTADIVREALAPISGEIELAFIFGSVAKGVDTASSDVDVLVVSDTLAYTAIYEALRGAEERLGRTLNPTVYSRAEFQRRIKSERSFVKRVISQPRIWIIGSDHDLAT